MGYHLYGDGSKSILDICLELKMSLCGSSDPLDYEVQKSYVEFLLHVLATWDWGNVTLASPESDLIRAKFDTAVHDLVQITLKLYYL